MAFGVERQLDRHFHGRGHAYPTGSSRCASRRPLHRAAEVTRRVEDAQILGEGIGLLMPKEPPTLPVNFRISDFLADPLDAEHVLDDLAGAMGALAGMAQGEALRLGIIAAERGRAGLHGGNDDAVADDRKPRHMGRGPREGCLDGPPAVAEMEIEHQALLEFRHGRQARRASRPRSPGVTACSSSMSTSTMSAASLAAAYAPSRRRRRRRPRRCGGPYRRRARAMPRPARWANHHGWGSRHAPGGGAAVLP